MIYNIVIIASGLIISRLLFYRFPFMHKGNMTNSPYKLSVIIPARNEERNLSLLLPDLKQQSHPIYEIICVDDCSMDNTLQVVASFGVKLITIVNKPEDWTGKAWACQKGAEAANGELLLFLDADVRLGTDAISGLMRAYDENKCVISVQPYHKTVKGYEQFSLFFNIVQIAANGTSTIPICKNAGLYGPVILIDKKCYSEIEGHTSVKNSIVDDLALGERLRKEGRPFKLFLGGRHISFRMYTRGFSELLQGWTKNYATGAIKTPRVQLVMVFLWITSCISVVINLLQSIAMHNLIYFIIFSFLYVLWTLELYRIARRIGNFKKLICFPIYLTLFLWVLFISFLKKLFHRSVVWKDRKIRLE